jgi:hypothetical protein
MASATKRTWNKRDRRHANMGRRRKAALSKHSTPSYDELFAALGAPGQPVQGEKN